MRQISLKYVNDGSSVTKTLNCVSFKENVVSSSIKGDTFSETKFEHVKSKRKQYELTISARDISYYNSSTSKYDNLLFIQNFYCNNNKAIQLTSGGSWIDVIINEDGTMPIEYLNNIERFKSITITLVEKNPKLTDWN